MDRYSYPYMYMEWMYFDCFNFYKRKEQQMERKSNTQYMQLSIHTSMYTLSEADIYIRRHMNDAKANERCRVGIRKC